ncbi:hypothetical protein HPB50_003769 [Hyalomma asiaticum]|uniref:Uncharacterized protein n=1 Tax=Hyalomma asiaticum TaxID=266040 RepID=A0ACB7TI59_HYAAI|nr:hypothetical protein HPB50_003769 [Hyalomma asiaticum]
MFAAVLLILSFVSAHDIAEELRMKRQTYSLPHGSELLLEPLTTRFICRHDGYFADVDNNCRVYHICTRSAETRQLQRFSFLCGNLTMFNQLTLTCSRPEDSVPCRNAPVFYYVNDNIGYQTHPSCTTMTSVMPTSSFTITGCSKPTRQPSDLSKPSALHDDAQSLLTRGVPTSRAHDRRNSQNAIMVMPVGKKKIGPSWSTLSLIKLRLTLRRKFTFMYGP